MPTSNERKMLSSNEALKELRVRLCEVQLYQLHNVYFEVEKNTVEKKRQNC